ncbi:hypothetical protein [Legionella impletisoli]|uniref:hypothetical protein n=1 Tax=Legionella impletisoli TaxID=343510 RepID=UPI0013EF9FF0|nr:hypothetical protein [Legionella impletisoli]
MDQRSKVRHNGEGSYGQALAIGCKHHKPPTCCALSTASMLGALTPMDAAAKPQQREVG